MNSQFDANTGFRSSSPSSNPGSSYLPYHWDGECHLILNNGFYSEFPQTPEEKMVDPMNELDFDIETPYDLIEDYSNCESESMSTGATATTSQAVATILEPKSCSSDISLMSLDAQLDFIMESTKRIPKPSLLTNEKKCKRSRKTPEQLAVLKKALEELKRGETMGKQQVVEMAHKTGLTEMKVYKWFWDKGFKLQ
eukprot:TRINITY_DN456_c0_g1_i8.p2 TRINITY_DN456_c0_g1~~TRINITY_DN456_c0_g1_i8.p2  ORF type:complete len:196 (-),score=71.61 TRINITY_DN456_c0_g1_i8:238-825(-)